MKQVSEKTRLKRCDRIMEAQYDIHNAHNLSKVGKTLTVLCEGFDPVGEIYYGRSEADAPEIDGKIYFSAKRRLRDGEFVDVEITSVIDYDLLGRQK
jgi:ribosomal protein S12 methylthiotransferase